MTWVPEVVVAVGILLLGFVLRGHERRIASSECQHRESSQAIAEISAAQTACKTHVEERLAAGEEYFKQFSEQVAGLKSSVATLNASVRQLGDVTQTLSVQVRTLDERIYQQKR